MSKSDTGQSQPQVAKYRGHLLAQLSNAAPTTLYLRDGELAIYRRPRSLLYQCRFKLPDGKWLRQSTGKASVEQAVAADLAPEKRSS